MSNEAILAACVNGDKHAEDFCVCIYEFLHLIDDLVDRDVKIPNDEEISLACIKLILTIGGNPFYQAHRVRFEVLLEHGFSAWCCSNRFNAEKKVEGKVLKSWYHDIFWEVARLTGGWEHMRKVCTQYRAFDMIGD